MNIDKWRLVDMIKVDNKHIIRDVSKKPIMQIRKETY